jgi:DNA modification methylase
MGLPSPYYSDESCTIYNADCREILPELGKFDLLLTDPPYGLGEKLRGGVTGMIEGRFNRMVDDGWDVTPTSEMYEMILATADEFIVWGANYACGSFPPSPCLLVWDKMNGTNPMADCEVAFTSMAGGSRMLSRHHFSRGCGGKVHPTQKPLPVMKWCLSFFMDAKTIIDPFAGSCTTGVAAKLEGRHATLIEISEKYCEIGAKRLRQRVLFGSESAELQEVASG